VIIPSPARPKYLGEVVVDLTQVDEFKNYTPADWAMYYIECYGQIDGGHHKQWVLDQVARILKNTPITAKLAKWDDGQQQYRVSTGEPSAEYWAWRKEMAGDIVDGEPEYDYDEGIPP
jgi:hypothetical protein